MRIFVSYAGEHRKLAESIAIRLKQDDHGVFFDSQKLAPGEEFDRAIRREISRCDLFIYLISPESVAQGTYALSELGLAQKRWPNPSGRLLPVMIAPTPMDTVPAYASAVTVLQPRGNPVAEVAAEVAVIASKRFRKYILLIAGFVLVATVAGVIWKWLPRQDIENIEVKTCLLSVQLTASPALPPALTLRVSGDNGAKDFSVTRSGKSNIDIIPSQIPNWHITIIDRDGAILGNIALDGCPTSGASYNLNGGISLEVVPRS